ncbi:hypothetical protein DL240_11130 [Lujinxingia litoralis]|uniref:Uncharacterized protein n=1 Tax=Lujinxingia litoralis TaxID=2211119 RepID=A0A328C8Z4_9DELT|nr:hypothetical protein [Lujinxingia litoralis]RAL22395.1 hypothetical protein DL240_11130 [Lujinxingia litoralis]
MLFAPLLALMLGLPMLQAAPAPPNTERTSPRQALPSPALVTVRDPSPTSPPRAFPNLEGRYAQKVVTTTRARVMGIGRVDTLTTGYLLADITQDGPRLELESTVCHAELSGSNVVRTLIPRAFINSLPTRTRQGSLSPLDQGWQLHVERDWDIRGVRLRDPANEALPDDPDDPRIVDQDGDGHPGLTVRVEGLVDGEVRVIQRGWDAYTFVVEDPAHLRGQVDWNSEQNVIDATSRLLRGGPESRPLRGKDHNRVELKRVAPSTTCATLRANPGAIFGD